jgi:hypothetical protein
MRKVVTALSVGLVLSLGSWLGFAAAASPGRSPSTPAKPVAHVLKAGVRTTTSVTGVAVSSAKSARGSGSAQSTLVTKGADPQSESENGNESESEQENGGGNETDGHEDPDGQDVNHECPPNCDTGNGEQP